MALSGWLVRREEGLCRHLAIASVRTIVCEPRRRAAMIAPSRVGTALPFISSHRPLSRMSFARRSRRNRTSSSASSDAADGIVTLIVSFIASPIIVSSSAVDASAGAADAACGAAARWRDDSDGDGGGDDDDEDAVERWRWSAPSEVAADASLKGPWWHATKPASFNVRCGPCLGALSAVLSTWSAEGLAPLDKSKAQLQTPRPDLCGAP